MDRELSVRTNYGDDNRGQRHGETPSGSWGPAGLTLVTDSHCQLHLRTDRMGRRVRLRQWSVLCLRSRLGGDWEQSQSGHHNTGEMSSKEHQLGK